MKSCRAVTIVTLILAMGAAARAQTCYSPITSWHGTYSLTGTGNGTACNGNPSGSCTTNHSSSANVSTNSGGASCVMAGWGGLDSNISLSYNDTEVTPCDPGQSSDTFTGATPVLSGSTLTVDLSTGTFSYEGSAIGSGTLTSIDCNGNQSTNPIPGYALYPVSNWPQTFALPSSPQTLSVNNWPFQAQGTTNSSVSWTMSFTLVPQYTTDDECKDQGSWIFPASSSIGCLNQSLGEDVPLAGTGFHLHYESGRAPGASGDSVATSDAAMIGGWTLSVHHSYDLGTHTIFFGDGTQRNGYQLGTPLINNGNVLFTSVDGGEVYVFNTAGQHLQTLKPFTGALVYQFGYDAAGNLITVTDASGNVTTIQRNAAEQATAIVSPYGQATTLSVDSNGFLNQVTDPLGHSATFVNGMTGLLASRTDANGNLFNYTYDTVGRLIQDADPVGGSVTASRTTTASGLGYTVTQTTGLGVTASYQNTLNLPWFQDGTAPFSEQHTNTWPDGLVATSSKSLASGQLTESSALPDGTSNAVTQGPDPRFGLQSPVLLDETLTQGSQTMNVTGSRTAKFTAGNPFTLTTQTDTEMINGRKYTSVFTGLTKTLVDETPVKRKATTIFDSLERVSSLQVGSLLPVKFAYDSKGRLSTITQGTRVSTLTYDANGFLASATDPLTQTTTFVHDADGRLLTETLPDGRVIGYTYDANGNLTSVTPPGKSAHDFSYTPVDLMSSYTPPAAAGTGPTTYSYDADRELTQVSRPDGETIKYGHDNAGRLTSTTTPTESVTYSYDATTGNMSGASIAGGEALAYTYDGPLPTSAALTGSVAGTVSRIYNNNFWVTSESINGGNTVNFTYDNEGLTTQAGSLVLKLDPRDGLITGTNLGGATDLRRYNTFGELTGYTAKYQTTTLYTVAFTRDADGRINGRTETVGGKRSAFVYTYDLSGRLTGVTQNGAPASSYTYDSNSNRLSATTASGTVSGTYDADDRLLTYGSASYTYTPNGELATQTVGSQKTAYSYDVMGNLTSVTLPSGTNIAYILDGENHRVGKKVNGALTTGFLYDDDRIVAQLDGSNALVSQFVYGSRSNTPSFMIQGGVTYRIFSDQLGSPRLVVNTSTGQIAEQISYDEFGNVITDTNPGFQPFGFAGGLNDQDSKLIRFGDRDYNPAVGRWTANDPILFGGGNSNLYAYVFNDPINYTDADGDQTRTLKVFDPNSDAAQASRTITQIDKGTDTAMKAGSAIADGDLETFVGKKAVGAAQDQIAPGAEKEQEKIYDEIGKNIPGTNRLSKGIVKTTTSVVKAIGPCPPPPPEEQKPPKGAPPAPTKHITVPNPPPGWTPDSF
ncbi:MAG TPA: RHS repeat-associated core domain-containing protein [Candidatus Sulfotelmatobacter sp.]